jgi:hypothetical protein
MRNFSIDELFAPFPGMSTLGLEKPLFSLLDVCSVM